MDKSGNLKLWSPYTLVSLPTRRETEGRDERNARKERKGRKDGEKEGRKNGRKKIKRSAKNKPASDSENNSKMLDQSCA